MVLAKRAEDRRWPRPCRRRHAGRREGEICRGYIAPLADFAPMGGFSGELPGRERERPDQCNTLPDRHPRIGIRLAFAATVDGG